MTDHRAIGVVNRFCELYTNLPLVGENVFKGRVYDYDNTPSHSIYLGAADVDIANTQVADVVQLIRDEIVVVGHESEVDALLLNVHKESYVKVMEDYTLGLSYVEEVELQGMSEPDYIDEGKRPILSAIFTWRVMYRHSYLDPSV